MKVRPLFPPLDAICYTGENRKEIETWITKRRTSKSLTQSRYKISHGPEPGEIALEFECFYGHYTIIPGEYLVRHSDGQIEVCTPAYFFDNYVVENSHG